MVGEIVFSKAGRDRNKAMVITAEHYLSVCDGKERRLERPKRKNPKHLQFTGLSLEPHRFETNRALRKALKAYSYEEEKLCQNQI